MITPISENKKAAASLSVFSNFCLIIIKFITGIMTGSVSILSEAIHSGSDLLASLIAFFAVNKSEAPADKEHQFGHGKYEDVAGFIEGLLIVLAALFIIYEAFKKLNGETEPLNNSIAGIIVMLISIITNILVSSYLRHVAAKTDSIALYSDAEHLRTDILSSVTVLLGLLIIHYTGLYIIDAIVAVIVAVIIINTGYKICKQTMNDLLDGSLPQNDLDTINAILQNYIQHGVSCIKEIKTRKSGKDKEINIILLVKGDMTVTESHEMCDKLENEIEKALGNTKITIHVEPLKNCCVSCQKNNI